LLLCIDVVIISPTVSPDKLTVSLLQLCKNCLSTSLQTSTRHNYYYALLLGTTFEKLLARISLVRVWYFSCRGLRVITDKGTEEGGRKRELEAQRGKVIRDEERAERKGNKRIKKLQRNKEIT